MPELALRDIIERLRHRREIGVAARQIVVGRRRDERLGGRRWRAALPGRHGQARLAESFFMGLAVPNLKFSLRSRRRGAFIIRPDCGTIKAVKRDRNSESQAAARRSGARAGRAFLCRALCDDPREAAAYLARKLRERGWDGRRRAAARRAGRADGGASAMSTTAPSPRPAPPRCPGAAMARGGSTRRCAPPGSARRMRPRRGRSRPTAPGRRRCASPNGAGSARSRPREADRPAREKALAAMLRAGHPAAARPAHSSAARPGEIPEADSR